MITIQGFAKLCGCNTQTLRYYDRIGLLAPAKVDQWTGYRYYEEEQALLFVKIKNLQQADFTIDEIKGLLGEDDSHMMAALERKIQEQEQKLQRIREIQRTYLKETMDMREMVNMISDVVENRLNHPELWQELGMDPEQDTETVAAVHAMLTDWLAQCRAEGANFPMAVDEEQISGMKEAMQQLKNGRQAQAQQMMLARNDEELTKDIPANAETVFARDGWNHVSEWIREIPDTGSGKQSFFVFRVREDSLVCDAGFPTLMLAVMAARYDVLEGGIVCKIGLSSDGQNHFALLQK